MENVNQSIYYKLPVIYTTWPVL